MKRHLFGARRSGVALIAVPLAGAVMLMFANTANAAIVPTVGMGTAANYSVLAGQGVTNVGNTTMQRNLGSSPLQSASGFPPGQVIVPGVVPTLSATPGRINHLGPPLGNATTDVLQGLLGLHADELARLRQRKTI